MREDDVGLNTLLRGGRSNDGVGEWRMAIHKSLG